MITSSNVVAKVTISVHIFYFGNLKYVLNTYFISTFKRSVLQPANVKRTLTKASRGRVMCTHAINITIPSISPDAFNRLFPVSLSQGYQHHSFTHLPTLLANLDLFDFAIMDLILILNRPLHLLRPRRSDRLLNETIPVLGLRPATIT